MRTKILFAMSVLLFASTYVFAQEEGVLPPAPSGNQGDMMQTPPPPGGDFRSGQMMPPPSQDQMMQNAPMGDRAPFPPSGGGQDPAQQYQMEYQKRYEQEVYRQTEQKMREGQQRSMPQGGGEFRSQGQQFQGEMRQSPGQPFMGERSPQGRPFEGGQGSGGFGGPGMGGEDMMGERGGFGGDGYGGENGESGFDSEEMEKRMEEQEKRMQQEQLKQMKRGVVSGMERGLKQIQSMMSKLSKKNIAIPADAQSLVSELTAALEKVKAATELTEDVETAMEVIQDKGQDLGEVGQKLGMLERMLQVTKQVEKEFTKIDKAVVKAKKSKTATQYADIVAKIEGTVSALKAKWESAKNGILSGEDTEDMKDIVDEIFEEVGEVHRSVALLQQLGSISKMVKTAEKEIAKFDKEIARQKKAGKDVAKLTELLAGARAKLAEVTSLSKQSGFDPEDLFDLMQELEHIRDQSLDELDRITGKADTKALSGAVAQAFRDLRL